jgi:altronate hydrolase
VSSVFHLHDEDDVAIARVDIAAGDVVDGTINARSAVPRGHKIATRRIVAGMPVRKYGQTIGFAMRDIAPGDHVHSHNLEFRQFEREYEYGVDARPTDYIPEAERATFSGYVRSDGRVGTRNYVAIICSVNCSATAAKLIVDRFRGPIMEQYPGIDGVVALTHTLGCGTAGAGNYGFDVFRRTLTGYANHPNIVGVLALGLGCEVNQINDLIRGWEMPPDRPLSWMTIQELGGTRKTVAEGESRIREMLAGASGLQRTTVPASKLVLGMECGGSDGYSGITANPALGAAADLLIRNGGTAAFGETTEIYGAEHLLTRRAASRAVGEKLIERIHWWEEHVKADGTSIDNNPSPGNKEGGLTTILEKSLGAAAKGGTTALADVVEYAEPLTTPGLVFMDTPGYDPVNATGLVAGGSTVMCFTTGRGSVFGCKPTPSLKLATNTPMYDHMEEDMDVNCGVVADGEKSIEEMGAVIFDRILRTASGKQTKSEELGFGDEEFAPWSLATTV